MITRDQLEELAKYFKIDEFTVFREYLQLIFLSYLYQNKKAGKIYFKGGTAIHLLFSSPRFSEDLDFSTNLSEGELSEIVEEINREIKRELPEAEIFLLHKGKKSLRYRLKYQSLSFKYPMVIRLDFIKEEKPQKIVTSSLLTRFPIVLFPLIGHFSAEEILAEKIRALLTRAKGRDLFDLWFLLEKGVGINEDLADRKLKEVGKGFAKDKLFKKIKSYPLKKLKHDLNKFLPVYQRDIWKTLQDRLNDYEAISPGR